MGGDLFETFTLEIFIVSIHAPAWGATATPIAVTLPLVFQSTPPHGGRLFAALKEREEAKFQSTPPHGGRLRICPHVSNHHSFNPRPRMGGDGDWVNIYHFTNDVSIHAPAWGATYKIFRAPKALSVSIHAPAWGATRGISFQQMGGRVSIHAPAWGATKASEEARQRRKVSIHAPAWGAT